MRSNHSDSLHTLLCVPFAVQNLEFYEWKLGHYSTFTYYWSLEIEKLIKIVFWAQIGSSQALEAGKCDFDSFCFAYSHRKLFARA